MLIGRKCAKERSCFCFDIIGNDYPVFMKNTHTRGENKVVRRLLIYAGLKLRHYVDVVLNGDCV